MKQIFLFITLSLLTSATTYSSQAEMKQAAYSSRSEQLEKLLYDKLTSLPRELIRIIISYDTYKIRGNIEYKLVCPTQATCLLAYKNGLISGDNEGCIKSWDLSKRVYEKELDAQIGSINSLALISNDRLAFAGWDGFIKVLYVPQWECYPYEKKSFSSSTICATDKERLIFEDIEGNLAVWNHTTGDTESIKLKHPFKTRKIITLPHKKIAILADSSIEVLSPKQQIPERTFSINEKIINTFVFIPPHFIVAGTTSEGTITIFDSNSGKIIQTLSGHTNTVNCLIELSDGRLASASDDGTIRFWECIQQKVPVCTTILTIPKEQGAPAPTLSLQLTLPSFSSQTNSIAPTEITAGITTLCQLSNGWLAAGDRDGNIWIIS